MNLRIQSQITSLDALFSMGEPIEDEEIKGHFAKYLCVRTSGLIENYMKSQISDYVDKTSSKPTAQFVKSQVKTLTNIKSEKIISILSNFNSDWLDYFNSRFDERLKNSLNSLITNRHNIAHGNVSNLTLSNVKGMYEDMKRLIMILDNTIK